MVRRVFRYATVLVARAQWTQSRDLSSNHDIPASLILSCSATEYQVVRVLYDLTDRGTLKVNDDQPRLDLCRGGSSAGTWLFRGANSQFPMRSMFVLLGYIKADPAVSSVAFSLRAFE